MDDRFALEIEPFEFREEDKAYELSDTGPSRKDLIHPRIDFHAQEALYRMFKGDGSARADAGQMFAAVKGGQLAGIYIINQRVPAMRAQKMKLGWWQVIPKGEDAVLLLDSANTMAGPPLIAFRDLVKSNSSRLDPALRKAWRAFRLIHTGQLGRCDFPISHGALITRELLDSRSDTVSPVSNVVPPILCEPRKPPKRSPTLRAPCSDKYIPPLTPNSIPPQGLVLLSHPHIRRCCQDGKDFSSDAISAPMSPATMNPGFLKRDGLIEFDLGLDKKLVDLLVDTPTYNVMLDKESIMKRTPSSKDKIRVALVDLTGDKICKPGFAGWGSTTPIAGGSTAKMAIVYAAHQLLFDLNELARIGGIGTAADLKTKATDTWSGLTCKPDINWLIEVDGATAPVKAKASQNLRKHLSEMVDAKFSSVSTSRASELILRLGFEYIASVIWQSGLRHPTRKGLWIGNTFKDVSIRARSNPACHAGTNPITWAKNPLGKTGIALTALSAVTFFTLLAQKRLVNVSTSKAMENLLATGCTFIPPLPGVAIRATKCGLTSSVLHDAALLEADDHRYVLAVLTTDPAWPARRAFIRDLDSLVKANNP